MAGCEDALLHLRSRCVSLLRLRRCFFRLGVGAGASCNSSMGCATDSFALITAPALRERRWLCSLRDRCNDTEIN